MSPRWAVRYTAVAWAAAVFSSYIRIANTRCPSCGNQFFVSSGKRNLFARQCVVRLAKMKREVDSTGTSIAAALSLRSAREAPDRYDAVRALAALPARRRHGGLRPRRVLRRAIVAHAARRGPGHPRRRGLPRPPLRRSSATSWARSWCSTRLRRKRRWAASCLKNGAVSRGIEFEALERFTSVVTCLQGERPCPRSGARLPSRPLHTSAPIGAGPPRLDEH
jgi:hypothetical protein